jgi:hypothetical protein
MVRQEETRERGKRIHLLEENAAFKNTIPWLLISQRWTLRNSTCIILSTEFMMICLPSITGFRQKCDFPDTLWVYKRRRPETSRSLSDNFYVREESNSFHEKRARLFCSNMKENETSQTEPIKWGEYSRRERERERERGK